MLPEEQATVRIGVVLEVHGKLEDVRAYHEWRDRDERAWFVALVAGPLALLDTLLPSRWISGAVQSAKPSLSSKGEPLGHYDIELEQDKFALDEQRARLLVQGQSIALRCTRLFDRVLEIRRPG